MMFQAVMFVSLMVMLGGGAIYYFNEEDHEHTAMTRLGLAITLLGLLMLIGSVVFLRRWPG
jgi:hypothetical protein